MTIDDYVKNVGFGDGSDRFKIDASGQPKAEGNATQWDDLVGAVTGIKLNDTKGTLEFNYNEGTISFETGGDITEDNDCVWFNLQKMHAIKEDSELRMHMHYFQTDTIERVFTLKYRIQDNNEAKTTAWTTLTTTMNTTNNVFPYTSGTLNQIVGFPSIDWSVVGISATIQFRLARTDALAGDVDVSFIDGHVEFDSDGSNEEYVK